MSVEAVSDITALASPFSVNSSGHRRRLDELTGVKAELIRRGLVDRGAGPTIYQLRAPRYLQ